MSIDRTQPMKPASSVQQRETQDTAPLKARSAESKPSVASGTQVLLSGAQSQLSKASSQDVNTVRVEELKTAIRNGELKMDSGKIADALIQQAKETLQGH
ncbi:flagellar biosynthesis anti-sigma factor FlgM [Erwinia amylovora]|uniref:Negative regulator of flagellin synthesis n=4 Tax=Erwinia amylovora TaxID=552 RepID=A0A831A0K9_ERWAM|nr:flagellar biosynthesis anti-sigma factor FlgM [Erwinia amylovora]CBX80312.1 Negative regulator of flagellin synthesis [Erwinia amylovora ATCC BAA-2158]CCP02861.1 Negative regulator of flagellin synthesis [Erwinia amylovora Ea644]CCP06891.1 Negative regulator of flagellin synthesis [Erwinia amylovora MR1]CDK14962.1 Negative regulator of flagellin synthesis [Erwinia amylovora LA635]CDK21699.1 Negative regulator of flagellin synthesis [Erwinia amylovora LA637]